MVRLLHQNIILCSHFKILPEKRSETHRQHHIYGNKCLLQCITLNSRKYLHLGLVYVGSGYTGGGRSGKIYK